MPAGRPSSFKPEYVEQAKKLARLGATDREAAEFFGVNEATLYRWKHTHEAFCEALRVGKDEADNRVVQSLYRKAVGYSHDAVKIAVNASGEVTQVPYVEHVPPSDTAAIFWLKNRRKEEWRDKQVVEHEGEVEVTDARERLARLVSGAIAADEASRGPGKPN